MASTTREIRNLILRVMELAVLINSKPTEQEITGNRPTVFVEFFGHTSSIYVRIYPNGWTDDTDGKECEYYDCYPQSGWDNLDTLYNVVERLEELYQEWGDLDESEDDEGGKHDE